MSFYKQNGWDGSNYGSKSSTRENDLPIMYNISYELRQSIALIPNVRKLKEYGIEIHGAGYHTEYLNSKGKVLARVDNLPWDMERKEFSFQGSGIFGETDKYTHWEEAVNATIDALTAKMDVY